MYLQKNSRSLFNSAKRVLNWPRAWRCLNISRTQKRGDFLVISLLSLLRRIRRRSSKAANANWCRCCWADFDRTDGMTTANEKVNKIENTQQQRLSIALNFSIVGTQRDKTAIRTKIKREIKRFANKRLSPDKRVVGTRLIGAIGVIGAIALLALTR